MGTVCLLQNAPQICRNEQKKQSTRRELHKLFAEIAGSPRHVCAFGRKPNINRITTVSCDHSNLNEAQSQRCRRWRGYFFFCGAGKPAVNASRTRSV